MSYVFIGFCLTKSYIFPKNIFFCQTYLNPAGKAQKRPDKKEILSGLFFWQIICNFAKKFPYSDISNFSRDYILFLQLCSILFQSL